MRPYPPVLLGAVAGALVLAVAAQGIATQPPPGPQQLEDLRKGVYEPNPVFGRIPHALPAYVAGALSIILLMRLLGFFEMGMVGTLALVDAIGWIVYRFYWRL